LLAQKKRGIQTGDNSYIIKALLTLLTLGADPNKKNIHDCTPLQWAAVEGDTKAVKALLADPRTNPNIEPRYAHKTPLQWAEDCGNTEEVIALLEDPRTDVPENFFIERFVRNRSALSFAQKNQEEGFGRLHSDAVRVLAEFIDPTDQQMQRRVDGDCAG